MPKVKTTAPPVDDHKNERNIDLPLYLDRIVPGWNQPSWLNATGWRNVVASQLLLGLCQDTITSYVLSKDWKVEPRDSTQRDELKSEIKYYTDFFTNTGDYEYQHIVEWLLADLLTLPFGAAAEVGRLGDTPEGRVMWIELLDGGTLYPTKNFDFPIGQYVPEAGIRTVYFPKHAINRIYMSPRTDIRRKGWGMAPPERIYLAAVLISRGDAYYANLLLDTPPTGILDLIDMSKDSATDWVKAWKEILQGINAFKIPVLYEHEKAAAWIPFTKNPSEIMFMEAVSRYGALVTSGYGLSLSDLGLSASSGDRTLAGSIREERKTRALGISRAKRSITSFFDHLLPETLRWRLIDLDDELSANLGRARLATATALNALVSGNILSNEESRQQLIADGLITITIPEKLPKEIQDKIDNPPAPFGANSNKPERPNMLGRPVTPGQGGWGEVAARSITERIEKITDEQILRMAYAAFLPIQTEVVEVSKSLSGNEITAWTFEHDKMLWGFEEPSDLTKAVIENAVTTIKSVIMSDFDLVFVGDDGAMSEGIRNYIARSVIAGVRNFLVDYPNADQDDLLEEGMLAIDLVREQLSATCRRIEQQLNDAVDDIINVE